MILTAAMDWQSLGDVQYRKWEVYAMLWDNIDLERLLVACAPFGGPVATAALDEKPGGGGAVGTASSGGSIFIYTASGTLLAEVDRGRGGGGGGKGGKAKRLAPEGFGWTETATAGLHWMDGWMDG